MDVSCSDAIKEGLKMTLVFTEMTREDIFRDSAFLELEASLRSDRCQRWDCVLPSGANPDRARLIIEYTYDGEYEMRFDSRIAFSGDDIGFASLCRQGSMRFQSMDEMKQFLRNMAFGEKTAHPAGRAAAVSLNRAAPATDRSQIQVGQQVKRHVDKRKLVCDIRQVIKGQDDAVEEIASWAAASAVKKHPQRPVSILLAGPTGAGKTLLGRTVGDALNMQLTEEQGRFGYIMIRCNEMKGDHMVARLTGAPAGYTGYGDDIMLSPVATNPYQVIIFDEIEKASPAVLDVLMSAMDSGEVTLNKAVEGTNTLDLRHCILLFTSNIELEPKAGRSVGFVSAREEGDGNGDKTPWRRMEEYCETLTKGGMRREIAARFASIIKFHELGGDALVDIALQSVQNLADEFDLTIHYVDPQIIQALYRRAGDLKFGARVINNLVERSLGILFGEHSNDSDRVFDLLGSLDSPVLRAYRIEAEEGQHLRPDQPGSPADDDTLFLDWDQDA